MSCLDGPSPPQLPTLSGISLPSFQTPTFSLDFNLCCHFNLFAIPPINITLPPFPGVVLAAINADIAVLDQYLAELDILHLTCPLDT